MVMMKVSMMIMTLWWGYSWADEILLDSLLESSNSRRDFDENYNRDVDNILSKKFKPFSSHILDIYFEKLSFTSTFGQTC